MSRLTTFFSSMFGYLKKNNVVLQQNGETMTEQDIEKMADTFANSATLGEALQNAVVEVSGGFNKEIEQLKLLQQENNTAQENRLKGIEENSAKQIGALQQELANAKNQIQQLETNLSAAINQVAQSNKAIAKEIAQPTEVASQNTQGVVNFHKVVGDAPANPKGIFDHLKE